MIWPAKKLGEVLDYEQPGKYIVNSKNYSSDYKTPVLTAGKTFILGNTNEEENIFPIDKLPVIIFDDFTTAIKFVDFPFKVKSSAMKILHAKKDVADIKYLFYLMKTIRLNHVTHKRYWISEYSKIEIPLPPPAEQKKIVARLEGLLRKIKEAKRLRAEAQEAAGGLLPAELRRIFAEGKKKGWEEKTIDQISENLDAKRVPITKSVRESGKYPYYGASGIVDHVNDYIFDESLLLISEDGANLFARVTPIAFSVSGKVWVNNHAHVLKFSELVTQRFVEYHVNSIDISEFITGSAQPKLNQGRLNRIKIPLPPVAEQKKIVARLDSLSEKIRRLQEYQKSTASDFISLEQSILSKSFQ